MLWRPVKDQAVDAAFCGALANSGIRNILRVDLQIGEPRSFEGLARTGLIIVNPPFTLEGEAKTILPYLTARLARGPGARFEIEWIARE